MKILILISFLALVSCQSTHTKIDRPEVVPSIPAADVSAVSSVAVDSIEPLKLGIILGPGGARALAHIGVLKQFHDKKVSVKAVVGIEWGALIAASFAQKGSAHEVEWQLSKIRDYRPQDQSDIRSGLKPLQVYLQSIKAESSAVPFACPSLNLKKSQVFMMARGRLDQLLPFCMAYPPMTESHELSLAAARELSLASDYLRSRGANYVLFVNVLPGLSIKESSSWLELAYDLRKKWSGLDQRLDILIDQKGIRDFKMQTDLIQLGFEQSSKAAEKLLQKM